MLEIIFTLVMLIVLQAVLGFDNLLYISLESKKAPVVDQKKVRKNGILIAIGLRIVLLFVLVSIIDFFQEPFSLLTSYFKKLNFCSSKKVLLKFLLKSPIFLIMLS
jgi:predicted tellurium resistance membrane protein TerC